MATVNITGEQFNSTIRGEGITLVDFWASWCGPCTRFGPVYEKASEANPDITFAKVDTEAEQGLASALGVTSIPTLMVFRDDVLVYRDAGAQIDRRGRGYCGLRGCRGGWGPGCARCRPSSSR